MLRFVSKAKLAMMKARKMEDKFNVRQIATAFKVKLDPNDTDEEVTEKYFQVLANQSLFQRTKVTDFYRLDKELNIVKFTVASIAKRYSNYSPKSEVARVIDRFCMYWGQSLIKMTNEATAKELMEEEHVLNMMRMLNHMAPLITLSKPNAIMYICLCRNVVIKLKNFDCTELTSSYRNFIDYLMNLPPQLFTSSDLRDVFNSIAAVNIHYWYYNKSADIIGRFYKILTKNWATDYHDRYYFFRNLTRLGIYSAEISRRAVDILRHQGERNSDVIKASLIYLVNSFELTEANQKDYQPHIDAAVKESPDLKTFCLQMSPYLYRAHLWFPSFWVAYFQRMDDMKIESYQFWAIYKTIEVDREKIDPAVIEASEQAWKRLHHKYPPLSNEELRRAYDFKYGGTKKKMSCQIQVANTLRLFNQKSVRTEVPLELFNVDIIVDNKYVVEVNGNAHFIYNLDKKEKKYTLKTVYRTLMLEKLGYAVINVELEKYGEGTFDLMMYINDEIQRRKREEQQKRGEQLKMEEHEKNN